MISLAVRDHKMVSKWHQTATHVVLSGLQHDCLKISSTQVFCNEPLRMQNLQNSNICRYVTHAPASQAKYWSAPLKGYQHHFVTLLYNDEIKLHSHLFYTVAFQVHRSLAFITTILSAVAFIIIFIHYNGFTQVCFRDYKVLDRRVALWPFGGHPIISSIQLQIRQQFKMCTIKNHCNPDSSLLGFLQMKVE